VSTDWRERIEAAAKRIAPHVRQTPVVQWPEASAWLKLENEQVTGSFKARGGGHKLLCTPADQRSLGVVTASSGNHGAGVAHAAKALGCPLIVFVPDHADPSKVARIQALGAQVRVHGDDCVDTERHARSWAEQTGRVYISPYNDLDVVAGQGTVGVELLEQVPELDIVYVSMGGGGLISGVGSYLKACRPWVEVVACSPAQSPAMHQCLAAGRIIDVPCASTLSDATAGGVEPGAVTFGICQQVIDRRVLVDESEIASAMRLVHSVLGIRIEGAAGVAVAAWIREAQTHKDRNVGIIICGGNIDENDLNQVLSQAPPPSE